jgi:hypothetical protein
VIGDQIGDLQGMISDVNTRTNEAKSLLQSSYDGYDYSGVDGAIDNYVTAKNTDTRARVYMIYLDRFKKSYTALQVRNLKLIDALSNNRDALIKRSTVIIPDSGTDIIRTLKLIQTESEANIVKTIQ